LDVEAHSGVSKTILDLLDNGHQLQCTHFRYFDNKIQYKPKQIGGRPHQGQRP
jgi:hypothetical protein